ncbi:hypothetical protein CTI12_AA077090 [Artemisia annua]|uniref:Uncharacterized protein n=1 Tax=Artemisia annua TaxID=35608 RepID=A0A2U1Q4N0_ARTAN|nr:hypothetical protein CTI12_AA077090 [Artemisia annua]
MEHWILHHVKFHLVTVALSMIQRLVQKKITSGAIMSGSPSKANAFCVLVILEYWTKDRVLAANAPYSGPVVEDGPDLTPSLALPTNSIAAIFSSSSHIVRTLRDTPLKELDVPQRAAAGSYTISDNIW